MHFFAKQIEIEVNQMVPRRRQAGWTTLWLEPGPMFGGTLLYPVSLLIGCWDWWSIQRANGQCRDHLVGQLTKELQDWPGNVWANLQFLEVEDKLAKLWKCIGIVVWTNAPGWLERVPKATNPQLMQPLAPNRMQVICKFLARLCNDKCELLLVGR